MARKAGTAILLLAVALAVALLLLRDEGSSRTRVKGEATRGARAAPPADVPGDAAAAAREERGPGGEEGRGDAPRDVATIRGTVSGLLGPIWGVRILAVVDENTARVTGSDVNGCYEVEVPADRDILLEVRPEPITGLLPQSRAFRLAAGAVVTYDCHLEAPPAASGQLDPAPDRDVTLFAIRAEDYPAPTDYPLLAAAAIDAAPKIRCTTHEGAFRFLGLDPDATYRLAADGIVWAVKDPVYFKAGDEKIVAQLDLVVPLSLDVTDIETGAPISAFTVMLRDRNGVTRDMLKGEGGRIFRKGMPDITAPSQPRAAGRWSDEAIRLLFTWTLMVGADGYFSETVPAHETSVGLQAYREPNVIVRVSLDDGSPFDGELVGTFGPKRKATLHVRKDAPGRLLATLPAGTWQVQVARPVTFFDAEPVLYLVVPRSGTIEPPPIVFPRVGSVTFESETEFTVQRLVDGSWHFRPGRTGRFDLPIGSYRIVQRGEVAQAFEVLPAGFHVVRVTPFR